MLRRVGVRVVVGVRMRVVVGMERQLVMTNRVRMGVGGQGRGVGGTGAGPRVQAGVRVLVRRSGSRSWSMMSAEVLIRLSFDLGCGLGVQAGSG